MRTNNLRQLYCHLRQSVQYLHNIFNCLEMTPAALKCQLIAVELCNLQITVFFLIHSRFQWHIHDV